MNVRRRSVLASMAAAGVGSAASVSAHGTDVAGAAGPPEIGQVASPTESSFLSGERVSLTRAEARFLRKHAALRAQLFERFAAGFEDPELAKESNFLPGLAETVAEFVGLGSDADEDPAAHQSIQATSSTFDDFVVGQIGLYSDLAMIAAGYSPVVGDVVDLVQKLQWFADVASQSSLQQVFTQGIRGCPTCEAGGRGRAGEAARDARQANQELARRARQTAEAARRYRDDATAENARLVATRLAAERRAGAEIPTIEAWASIDPNDYSTAAAGLNTPKAVRKLARANVAVAEQVRQILCLQLGTLGGDERLVVPTAIEAYNENVDAIRTQIPSPAFERFTEQTGNVFVTTGSDGGVRTAATLGIRIGSSGRIVDYSLTPMESNFDAYVDSEAIQLLKEGVSEGEVTRLSNMDVLQLEGNGLLDSMKYEMVELVVSRLLTRLVDQSSGA